ncbi:MAG: hypothetical protein KJP20_09690, partial [Bacteroidia bacterium]|nr:hypothetical protein [Bacteroidia bacterium]
PRHSEKTLHSKSWPLSCRARVQQWNTLDPQRTCGSKNQHSPLQTIPRVIPLWKRMHYPGLVPLFSFYRLLTNWKHSIPSNL